MSYMLCQFKWLLCYFVCYIPFLSRQEISRSQSRQLVDALVAAVHQTKPKCSKVFVSLSDVSQNHSELLLLNPSFNVVVQRLITEKSLQSSFGPDIEKARVFSEFIFSWMNSNENRETTTRETQRFLESTMRAFLQVEHMYSSAGNHNEDGGISWKTYVRSLSLCSGNEMIQNVRSISQGSLALPKELCLRMHALNVTQDAVASLRQNMGYWAPLYCNQLAVQNPVLLHLIFSSPVTYSIKLIFEFDIRNLKLDLCAAELDFCRHSTTECIFRQFKAWPFDVGNYICQCKPGFYANNAENGYPAELLERKSNEGQKVELLSCKVCPSDCPDCTSGRACGLEYNMQLLRGIPLAVQTFCITICLFLGIVTFRLRRTRVFKAANWLFLELFLTGGIILYSTTIVMYFRASELTCFILPWLREVGFSMFYGALLVKLYRALVGFQSRKAHRVHVRDKDLFKYFGCFIVVIVGYMLAWTAVNLDYIRFEQWFSFQQTNADRILRGDKQNVGASSKAARRNTLDQFSMLMRGRVELITNLTSVTLGQTNSSRNLLLTDNVNVAKHYQYFRVCRALSWDFFVELAECFLLSIGVHYCRLIWSAPTEYQENRCISIALAAELFFSGTLYIIRYFIWYTVHPDIIFLIYFFRCHLTVTLNICIIFGLKLWYVHKPPSPHSSVVRGRGMVGAVPGASAAPHLVSSNKLRLASNGELDLADVNLADMDPEVIGRELRRLYTTIEIYKTKAMRRDNPHISKRRGGRKQRRFSLQPFHKKHHGPFGTTTLSVDATIVLTDLGSSSNACLPPPDPSSSDNTLLREPSAATSTGGAKSPSSCLIRGQSSASHSVYHSIILDEETSRVSEESCNSMDDRSTNADSPTPHQKHHKTTGQKTKKQHFPSENRGFRNKNC